MAGQTGGGITKNFVAGGAIGAHRFTKFGAADDTVVLAAAAADLTIGVTTDIAAAAGERVDVHLDGVREVYFGGNVTRGNKVTSDANGAAIAAAAAGGANVQVAGVAMCSGVAGDIGAVLIVQSVMQG